MIVILVVSSEERIGRHVRSVLGSQGWWVTTAADREEALRASADQQPGLVIVDCEIEGAAELVRTFGAKNGGPGVLLLEPPGDGDGAFHAFEAGADQILSKPPRGRELLEAAERVMALPHQSAGASVAGAGEKLSAEEIFGELLMELEATKPRTTKPGTTTGRTALESPEPLPEVSAEVSAGPERPRELDPPSERETPSESLAGFSGESSAEEAAPSTAANIEEANSSLGLPRGAQGAEAGKTGEPGLGLGSEDPPEDPSFTFDPKVLGDEEQEDRAAVAVAGAGEAGGGGSEEQDSPSDRADSASPISLPETPVEGDRGRFGQYRLDERIAVGGMAEVWRASMLGMEGFRKTIAIKKILPHLAENSEFVAMFIEEAKLAAQLSHENLVEIYDLGKIGESFFIAMEFVDGKDLRGLLNRLRQASEQMPIGLALLITAEVARGLEYAHTREDSDGKALDLVHRDVSPRNVLIGHDGRVRLCDFGVAKAVSSVIQTQIGALKGKLQYMSPEQASGRSVDNRSDIYSLGSVMYEMISGRRLYEADNEISLLDAARAGNFDDPSKHCPALPQEVRRILIKALAKKPSARYQSAGALEQDLRALLRTVEPAPGAQVLGSFVKELFAERTATEERPAGAEVASASAVTATLDGSDAATRSWPSGRPSTLNRVARFWWGVAAGLLAAGLGAVLLELVLG
ncbi:MAG: protein kinase [Acidobacteria bacterium]|nr:protein kinase [Acidobacteriota bacterium]